MFASGVSENVLLLSMRSDILFTDADEYKENYIAVANQKDEYERTQYPYGVWIVRLETKRAPNTTGKGTPRWNMGRFRSKESALKFIRSRVEPDEVPRKIYPAICACLAWQYMIDYKKCGDIVFEQCRHCGMPTKEIFREPLNKLIVDEFDLDEFLGL